MKKMYVYILSNKNNNVLYIGVTNDIVRRVYEHKNHFVEGFSDQYNVEKLVYYECYEDELTAIQREKYLKRCYRKTKEKLIKDFNPEWSDLYSEIC